MRAIETFHPGDVVTLKSGGAVMTIAAVSGDYAECVWTEKNRPLREHYPFVVLKKHDSSSAGIMVF